MHPATGRTQTTPDCMDPARARALHAVLGLDGAPPDDGDPLPSFWHQVYFWAIAAADGLGEDGHPALGGFIPDLGLPNRMWAGGRLEFRAPLILGRPAERRTTLESIAEKEGRSGRLAFVTLRHEMVQGDAVAVTEWQDIVYRAGDARGGGEPPVAPTDEYVARPVAFDAVMLFRYSALTFNAHRIHYDADYCRDALGYAGVVVHGPLLAQSLMTLAGEILGGLRRFAFRATAPLIAGERAELCWRGDGAMWIRGPGGGQVMQASAA